MTVQRNEIVDYQTYDETRDAFRSRVMELKRPRRIHVGEHLTFLFENCETIRYQVQEMMRTERIVKEADILHELATYNELLGGPGELGCTLLVEIEDVAHRAQLLRAWIDLPAHLYARLESGDKIRATYDARQISDRLSSVQYIKFATRGEVPVALGSDHPDVTTETTLSVEQRQALAEDLRSSR